MRPSNILRILPRREKSAPKVREFCGQTELFTLFMRKSPLTASTVSHWPDTSATVADLKCLKIWDFFGKKWAVH